jgi:hypothetical protein
VRAFGVASIVALVVAVSVLVLGTAMLVLGILVGLLGVFFCLTGIGAVIGIPLLFVGAIGFALGAVGTGGVGPALFFGALVGGGVYLVQGRRERRELALDAKSLTQ